MSKQNKIFQRKARITVLMALTATLLAAGSVTTAESEAAAQTASDAQPVMRKLETPAKTRFGLFGEKPSSPAPTLFVFAGAVEDMDQRRIYSEAGRQLARNGWLYVTLDLPCHGHDHRAEEPATISGWAHRVRTGDDLTGPFVKRCIDVLDFLVAQG